MAPPGFKIIRFRGRYWIFVHPHRAEGLGHWLVNSVPVDPEQYQKWLQSQRDTFTKWDSLLQEFLTIRLEDMRKLRSNEPLTPVFHDVFDRRLHQNAPPYYEACPNNLPIQCIYTIDLDREVFSVDCGAHFRLNHIPRNDKWARAIYMDNHSNRFLLPHLVPAESVATLALDPPDSMVSTNNAKLQTRIVTPKNLDLIPSSTRTGPRLRWILFNFFQKSQHRYLSASLLSWRAQDLPFRELAFFILCLAKGGEHLALTDERLVKEPDSWGSYLGLKTQYSSELDIELASCLGVGYHMAGLPIGSAPEETKYWFEGALICLEPRLDFPGILEAAIANAMEYGCANCTAPSFNAILISIEHLVLVKLLPDGTIDHTELLPLIPLTCHLSKDARARYGDEIIDAFYAVNRDRFEPKVKESKESDVKELNQDLRQQGGRDDGDTDYGKGAEATEENGKRGGNGAAAVKEPEDQAAFQKSKDKEEHAASDDKSNAKVERSTTIPVLAISIRTTFMALIQFFEATTLETLRPTSPNEARLPEELCEMVLRKVCDMKTYNACLKVSRRFRFICQARTLVMDNVVFLEPLPRNPALPVAQEKEKSTQNPQPPPDFLAVEVSSDRQMDVWLRFGSSHLEGLRCLVVAGKVLNRKTFANFKADFIGLHIPLPDADEAGNHTITTVEPERRREPVMYDSEGTGWEEAFRCHEIMTECKVERLGGFWREALGDLGYATQGCMDPDWTFPPHTMCYLMRQSSFFRKAGVTEAQIFYYVYLRLKKASKYWGHQWDDMIREATEHLNHTDDDGINHYQFPAGEVMGAQEPFVILIVGLQVRLFRWKQGFDDSVDEISRRQMSPFSRLIAEPTPGTVLNVTEKGDREVIEKFMHRAKQYKRVITKRAMIKHQGWDTHVFDRT